MKSEELERIEEKIARRCGGTVCATTGLTSSRSVLVYVGLPCHPQSFLMRRFDGLVGYDKEVLR